MTSKSMAESPVLTGASAASSTYEVSWLAKFFHSFPHINLSFETTNSSFAPEEAEYREAIIIAASIPLLWLVLVLILFMCYCCFRTCRQDNAKRKKIPCLKWTLGILLLLISGVVGMGLFGNESFDKGVASLGREAETADQTVSGIQEEISRVNTTVNKTINEGVVGLEEIFNKSTAINETARIDLASKTANLVSQGQNVLKYITSIHNDVGKVDLEDIIQELYDYESYRWLATLVWNCVELFIYLVLFCAIIKQVKCLVMLCTGFLVFILIMTWITTGLYLGVSVGLGDFCFAPNTFVETQLKNTNALDKNIADYYINCSDTRSNPFSQTLRDAQNGIFKANDTLANIYGIAEGFINDTKFDSLVEGLYGEMDSLSKSVQDLTVLTDCTTFHNSYVTALKGVCYKGLEGMAFLLLSAALVGLMVSFIIVLNSRAWRRMGKSAMSRKGHYSSIDEDDPFIPAVRNGDTSPKYYSGRIRRERMAMESRGSPPPAYDMYGGDAVRSASNRSPPTNV